MSWKPDICIYHFPCDDGFGAAFAVWQRWRDGVEYAPCNYGKPPPDVAGKNVLIADFSFKPAVIEEMAKSAKSLVILDHHKTAKADLAAYMIETDGFLSVDALAPVAEWPNVYAYDAGAVLRTDDFGEPRCARNVLAVFDMERSGAMLAWMFVNGADHDEAPAFFRHLEDRDLWRMALPGTRRFSLALRSYDFDFQRWYELRDRVGALIEEGRNIERFYDRKVGEVCDTAVEKDIGGKRAICASAPYFMASDVANELLNRNPEAPFAAVKVEAYGGVTYSLRSEDSREDVSSVAKQYGGGGHRNAAGFRHPG
jgi:hypothetical protein